MAETLKPSELASLLALRKACDDPGLWYVRMGGFLAAIHLVVKPAHRSSTALGKLREKGFAESCKPKPGTRGMRWRITPMGRKALEENGHG